MFASFFCLNGRRHYNIAIKCKCHCKRYSVTNVIIHPFILQNENLNDWSWKRKMFKTREGRIYASLYTFIIVSNFCICFVDIHIRSLSRRAFKSVHIAVFHKKTKKRLKKSEKKSERESERERKRREREKKKRTLSFQRNK